MKAEYYIYSEPESSLKCYFRIRNLRPGEHHQYNDYYKDTKVVTECIRIYHCRAELHTINVAVVFANNSAKFTKKEWNSKLKIFKECAKNFK